MPHKSAQTLSHSWASADAGRGTSFVGRAAGSPDTCRMGPCTVGAAGPDLFESLQDQRVSTHAEGRCQMSLGSERYTDPCEIFTNDWKAEGQLSSHRAFLLRNKHFA